MKRVKTTTVCLPEELVEEIKRAAFNESRSFSNMVTMLLMRALQMSQAACAEEVQK